MIGVGWLVGAWFGASALAAPPEPSELSGTGHTLPRGSATIHPIVGPSAVGLTDRVELHFPTFGVVLGAWAGVGLGLAQTDAVALSFELGAGAPWGGGSAFGSARFDLSVAAGSAWCTLQVGVGGSTGDVELSLLALAASVPQQVFVGIPVGAVVDLPVVGAGALRASGRVDVSSWKTPQLTAGLRWVQGLGRSTRFSLGVAVYGGPHPAPGLVRSYYWPLLQADPLWLPLPTAELWWRL